MPDEQYTQLALWNQIEDTPDKKPIPQEIARFYDFDLQRVEASGTTYYSVQDWLRGIGETPNSRRYWSDMKKRATGDQKQLYARCVQLPYLADNGKTYQMDYADEELIYFITQRMESTIRVVQVLALFAKYLKQVSEHRRNPELAAEYARQRYVASKVAQGMSESDAMNLLRTREDAKDDFKRLSATIYAVCTDTPNMPKIINAEYVGLFGKVANELKVVLESKSIRDALPELQLSYLRTAEAGLRKVLEQRGRLSNDRIIYAARQVCDPLGVHLQSLCEALGIDHITGKPLLPKGQ